MKQERAFTLVELLVALALTAVLVVLLANVVSATLSAWQQGRNRLDTFSAARQLMGRITDQISAAVAVKDRIEFVENASELNGGSAQAAPKTSENVFFVAPYPNSGSGDLCVVMYRHDAVNRRLEFRLEDSSRAWAAAASGRYKASGYPDDPKTSRWRAIADGVLEFELRSYSQSDLDKGDTPADTWSSRAMNTATEGKTPRRIVVRLKVVDDRTLVRLAAMTPGTPAYDDALKRAAREFFSDFRLPAR